MINLALYCLALLGGVVACALCATWLFWHLDKKVETRLKELDPKDWP